MLRTAGAGSLAVLKRILLRNGVRINKIGAVQLFVDVALVVRWVAAEVDKVDRRAQAEFAALPTDPALKQMKDALKAAEQEQKNWEVVVEILLGECVLCAFRLCMFGGVK